MQLFIFNLIISFTYLLLLTHSIIYTYIKLCYIYIKYYTIYKTMLIIMHYLDENRF